jgi:hypothetical protein
MNGSLARQLRAIPGSKSQGRLLRRQYSHSGPERRAQMRAILDKINGVVTKGGKVVEFEIRGHEAVAKGDQHGSQSIKKLISDSRSREGNN